MHVITETRQKIESLESCNYLLSSCTDFQFPNIERPMKSVSCTLSLKLKTKAEVENRETIPESVGTEKQQI